jgi:hypothetical protein
VREFLDYFMRIFRCDVQHQPTAGLDHLPRYEPATGALRPEEVELGRPVVLEGEAAWDHDP